MNKNILVVDDDPQILSALGQELSEAGLKSLTAISAEDALALLREEQIAILLTDNCMPSGMNGLELLKIAKTAYPDTVRLLMTGHADLDTAVRAINESEVYKFILKPWQWDALLDVINESMDRFNLVHSLRHSDEAALLSLAQAVELKDHDTRGHCERVAEYATIMTEALELSDENKKHIRYGCWLHDCGKIGVPEKILNKKGPLDWEELQIVRNHSLWGAEVANQAKFHQEVINVVLHHHEQFNGEGYPAGLKGHNIPLEARIVTIADVFDALTTDRPYRKRFSREKAIQLLRTDEGVMFDPELVGIFLSRLHEPNTLVCPSHKKLMSDAI